MPVEPRNPKIDDRRERVAREYANLARNYDRRWSFFIRASISQTLRRLPLIDGQRVLDVGCGTGALLQALLEAKGSLKLAGIDPVKEMLAVARKRLPLEVSLQSAWAESLPFEDRSFDLVISCNMFHYVNEPSQALLEMRRVLTPTGHLVLTDWCDDFLTCKICDIYLRLTNAAHKKTYGSRELEELLGMAGFSGIRLERYKISWLWGLMTAVTNDGRRDLSV